MDRGVWQAAVCGVAKNRTQHIFYNCLKQMWYPKVKIPFKYKILLFGDCFTTLNTATSGG